MRTIGTESELKSIMSDMKERCRVHWKHMAGKPHLSWESEVETCRMEGISQAIKKW